MDSVRNPKSCALAYVEHFNMSVFPLWYRSKKPITDHGFKDASKDPTVIGDWWTRYPCANIGCATGLVSNIVVLDIDPKPTSEEVLKNFVSKYNSITPTLTARSGRGGFHFYYRTKIRLPSRVGIIEGVDFRGDGGYIVLPPSIHENGNAYQWLTPSGLPVEEIAEIPQWLIDVILKGTDGNSSEKLYNDILSKSVIKEGQRTSTMTSMIGHLLARGVLPSLVRKLVHAVNTTNFDPPLDSIDVEKILNSIASKELKKRKEMR